MPAALLLCVLLQTAPEPLHARPVISGTEGGLKAEVRNQRGEPVPGVRILLRGADGRAWMGTTDVQGRCLAGGLTPGEYRLELRCEPYPSAGYARLQIRANAWLLGAEPLPRRKGPHLVLAGPPGYEGPPTVPITPLRREPGKIPMH